MGKIYFNYKGRKYKIDFFDTGNNKACILTDTARHENKLFYFDKNTRVTDLLKTI